jgi:tetratricopeptide (TPR) repeat protein
VFRDQQDLSAGDDLGEEIKAALAASQFLIVLCSPTAARSRWTNAEIESFKRTRPEGCVLAAVLGGEPFASDIPGREDEECFPPALRYKYDRRGHQTTKRAEPLAADFREAGEGKRMAFLKLVAGMLGVGLDELVQRDTTRRHRQLAWLAAGSLAGMTVTSALAVTAFQARNEAREQRREAEGLIGFMLGDLKAKLEPIGKLDALDGVGTRVLAYYQKQSTRELSDAALLQRSRALSLMGQVSYERGRLDDSVRLFREAMAGTAEAIERNPNDPQRLYEHAQNYFYLGEIARQKFDFGEAEKDYREYQRLSARMVALEPDNLKWRMEAQYGQANVGISLLAQRRFAEAGAQFAGALRTIEALASVDPSNADYQEARSLSLAWLADTEWAQGHLDAAIAYRERQATLLDGLMHGNSNVAFRQWAIPAHQGLGILYASRGQFDRALPQLRAAVDIAGLLIPVEPGNDLWKRLAASSQLELGKTLLAANQPQDAAQQVAAGCASVGAAKTLKGTKWGILRTQCLAGRARLALASGQRGDALRFAVQALSSARLEQGGDPIANRYSIVAAYRLLGNVRAASGDAQGARDAWSEGLSQLPASTNERPAEMYEHAELLRRLGRAEEARGLDQRLSAMGFRSVT